VEVAAVSSRFVLGKIGGGFPHFLVTTAVEEPETPDSSSPLQRVAPPDAKHTFKNMIVVETVDCAA
jgi:hypothetical protein